MTSGVANRNFTLIPISSLTKSVVTIFFKPALEVDLFTLSLLSAALLLTAQQNVSQHSFLFGQPTSTPQNALDETACSSVPIQ